MDLNQPNIIVAEKDLSFRRRLVDLLEDMGFTNVHATPSGTAAWSLIKRLSADLIVSGTNLQEIGGLSLLKIVRADSAFVTTPYLLVSEVITQGQVVEAGEAGVSEILCRPINMERLKEKVNQLLYPSEDAVAGEADRVYQRGLNLMAQERWQEALAVFKHILTLYESPEVYYNLGYINTVMENYEEAIAYFRKATEIDQTFARAYQRMGECYLALGDADQAQTYLQRAAQIYLEKEKHEASRGAILEEVMRVNPKTINVFNTLGIIYRRQGKYREAADQYIKALKVNPQDEHIHYNLGRTFFELEDMARARKSLAKALEISPDFEEARKLLLAAEARLAAEAKPQP